MSAPGEGHPMTQSGFYWIRLKSPQGHVFQPLVAWTNRTHWRIPGSAEAIPEGAVVEVLEGPLAPPQAPAETAAAA